MSEQSSTDSKQRGGGFPSLPLKDAVDAVVAAGLNGPNHTVDAFAAYLGHATSNSGAFRAKMASFRDWGLVSRGDRERVTLTELAQELVLKYPDHYEDKQALLAAFESCRIFGRLYDDSAKNTPLEVARLRNTVLIRYGVGNNQADKFVDSFVQSAAFAGLAKVSGSTVTLVPRDASLSETGERGNGGVEDPVDADATTSGRVPVPTAAATSAPVSQTPVALQQQWPIDGGEIEFVIRTFEALPPSIYVLVAEMAEVAEKMKVKLTGPAFEITTSKPPSAYRAPDDEG